MDNRAAGNRTLTLRLLVVVAGMFGFGFALESTEKRLTGPQCGRAKILIPAAL